MPVFIRSLIAFVLAAAWIGLPSAALAQTPEEEWIELDLGRFVLIYPAEFESQFGPYTAVAGQAANEAYDQLARLYGEPVTLPINVRVYINAVQFTRLNPLAPLLAPGLFHTHIGTREIALVAPFPPQALEPNGFANVMRHELNGLFLSALSSAEMPAGLELGINQYAEQPGAQVEEARARLQAALDRGMLLSWSELFTSGAVYSDTVVAYPQSLSVAAFLIDSYGFASIVELAQAMAQRHGHRAAFAEVYDRPIDRLEEDWRAYLPVYLETRWQFNALYSYDLSPFEAALAQGSYTQVARSMEVVIPFLNSTGQVAVLDQAEAIRQRAVQGIVAGQLVKEARDALQRGDYPLTIQMTEQAQAAYAALGDSSRLGEINLYAERARELMELHARLEQAQQMADSGQTLEAEAELSAVAARFEALGDTAGAQTAATALSGLNAQRATRAGWATIGAVLVGAVVLAHRVYVFMRRQRRREFSIL